MSIYDEVIELAKRRGIFWPSFSIYGGQAGFYDYGPIGVLLKDNVVSAWKHSYLKEGAIFIDTPNVTPSSVFRASGHLEKFADLAVECPKCKSRYKLETVLKAAGINHLPSSVDEADQVLSESEVKCLKCGNRLMKSYSADQMFRVEAGQEQPSYLRPETAQGMMVNFKLLNSHYRGKLPMAVAQLGKAFRNEISPRQSLLRLREIYQGEVEVFLKDSESFWKDIPEGQEVKFKPSEKDSVKMTVRRANDTGLIKDKTVAYFINKTLELLSGIGILGENIRFRQHDKDELAHYSSDCWDAEALLDGEWVELVGIADRGTYDLKRHMEASGENMMVNIDGKQYLPRVVEPAHGIDRMTMALLMNAYYRRENGFAVLKFNPIVAPYHAAVLPLMKKDGLREKAEEIYEKINDFDPAVVYDETGTIGKRYARQDEIGTPYCITVDYETLENSTVTVRFRDSTEQIRVTIDALLSERKLVDSSVLAEEK